MLTLANFLPGELPKLKEWLPEPPPKWPIPKWLAHKWGLNPGKRTTYWPQTEDRTRWDWLVGSCGLWSAKRAASFSPTGDWDTLEAKAKSFHQTVLARM